MCGILFTYCAGDPYKAATLAVLGGEKEMPWNFDRLFKVEITDALSALSLNYDDYYKISLAIKDVNGKDWPENTFSHSTIIHEEGTGKNQIPPMSVCPSLNTLTPTRACAILCV